jgi:CubicO group peptidase (beta-lactamase class C family)
MTKAAIAALALAGAALAPAASAKDAPLKLDPARIDRELTGFVDQGRVAGAEVLIWKDGRERYYASAGLADREAARPFTRDTLVQIYSMTKPVTGVALMQLWEQGKFGLDDPLSRYLPQFAEVKVYDGTNPDGSLKLRPPSRPITVRDVMRHIAGFTYGGAGHPTDAVWDKLQPLSPDHTLAQFADILPQVPLLSEPGVQWQYSPGVDVQARLVEVLSGQPFDQYVAEHVFKPLGMTHSCWKCSGELRPRLAAIYDGPTLARMGDETWLVHNFAGKPMTEGGAGIVTTIDDYMRFARMLLGEGELDGARLLQPATIRLMSTDQLDPRITERQWLGSKGSGGFGLDFFVRTRPPKDAAENRGAVGEFFWDGYPSMLFWIDPANDMAVVFATQKTPFDGTLHHDIRQAIYGAGYGQR